MKKKLGEILIEQGVVTQAQLDLARAEQERTGGKLGRILTGLGFATEAEISQALSLQTGVQQVDLGQIRPTPEALDLIREALALEYELLPLRIEGDSAVVAMANPTDVVAIDRIQRLTNLFVRVIAAPRTQVRRDHSLGPQVHWGREVGPGDLRCPYDRSGHHCLQPRHRTLARLR